MQARWFSALVCAVCLEGLGRRYIPVIPSVAFYFLKDAILLFGYVRFRPGPEVRATVRHLYRGFGLFVAVGFAWTVAEVFNPEQQSFPLGLIGLRSYWLWWIAPAVIATALQQKRSKEQAIQALLVLSIGVAALAAVQFASPADSSLNMYSVWNGEEVYSSDIAVVASTGRARVASTFAFITGFVDFTILVPALLLSLGLDSDSRRVRWGAQLGTLATAAVVPMAGSRSSVVLGCAILLITLWSAGLFFTRVGRRVLAGAAVAVVLTVVAFPEAFSGVQSRFDDNAEETAGRFQGVLDFLPPFALAKYEYPAIGIGTGMQQNARVSFGAGSKWDTEAEMGRYLVEIGPFGFLLVWFAKLGLAVALLRSYSILKKGGRRGSAGAALSYAAVTIIGNTTFDHNWQALYFIGCGFILAEVVAVRKRAAVVAPEAIATGEPLPWRPQQDEAA